MSDDLVNKNTGTVKRSPAQKVKTEFNPGPFVATVKNHLDSTYMGNLEVELLTASGSGNSPNTPGKTVAVSYLNPFYGVSASAGLTANEGHQYSQKSYGMWFVPPDVGQKVLVIFAESGQGYWLGCIMEENMNMMIPAGNPSTTYNAQDSATKLPVVEYNKEVETAAGRDATKFIKPVNTDALDVLTEQGLDKDETRGLTSSSARRNLPSTVFGVSTPGPADRREGAPLVRYGENFAQGTTAFNRLGGSSIVMDDGDPTLLRKTPPGGPEGGPPEYANAEAGDTGGDKTRPHNELLRIKTRTGHQILLHNTEDLIYIANSRGTSWIELTSNGKVDIYAASDVSIHSEANMNFKADGSMYFEAGADIHMKAGANIFQTADANWEIKVGADGKLTTGGLVDIKSGGDTRLGAANTHWTASKHTFTGNIDQNSATATEPGESADAQPSQRVPEHEPWDGHENLHEVPQADINIPDTFRKSTTREESPAEEQPAEEDTGVIDSPQTGNTGGNVSTETTEAINNLPTQGITTQTVNAVRNTVNLNTIKFPSAQAILSKLDSVISPTSLQNVANGLTNSISGIAGEIEQGAAGLLSDFRTRLAKVNTV